MSLLFDPINIGSIECPNRVFMAPLTRARADKTHVPTAIMKEYYMQRASAGLIISEATAIGPEHMGWPYAPGIWSDEQIAAWLDITKGVHSVGGRIICQIWAMGRIVHSDFLNGNPPISSSATTAPDFARTYEGKKPFVQARALKVEEIPPIIQAYRMAARNAMAAGFDGVQIHAANGYLIDQFLRNNVNLRNDGYGGSVANRIRFLGEVVSGVVDEVGQEQTSVRLSPNGEIQGANDSDPVPLFVAAAELLENLGIASLELREPGYEGVWKASHPPIAPHMRKVFHRPMILNSDFYQEAAESKLLDRSADAISFGRAFISNPDLPGRFKNGIALAEADEQFWYTNGSQGYTDYPEAKTS